MAMHAEFFFISFFMHMLKFTIPMKAKKLDLHLKLLIIAATILFLFFFTFSCVKLSFILVAYS